MVTQERERRESESAGRKCAKGLQDAMMGGEGTLRAQLPFTCSFFRASCCRAEARKNARSDEHHEPGSQLSRRSQPWARHRLVAQHPPRRPPTTPRSPMHCRFYPPGGRPVQDHLPHPAARSVHGSGHTCERGALGRISLCPGEQRGSLCSYSPFLSFHSFLSTFPLLPSPAAALLDSSDDVLECPTIRHKLAPR